MNISNYSLKELPECFAGNPLSLAYLHDYGSVADFYSVPPEMAAIIRRLESYPEIAGRREKLAAVLKKNAARLSRNPQAAGCSEAIKSGKTFVVVTGQQAGLLGGPLYTVFKAMHAVKLAEHLSLTTDFNVLPVFWIASEDHDLQEIDHIHLVDLDNEARRFHLPVGPPGAGVQFAHFSEDPAEFMARLDSAFPETEFKGEMLGLCRQWLELPVAASFREMMLWLFRNTPLLLVDPFMLRELGGPVIADEIRNPGRNAKLVDIQGAALKDAGFAPPVSLMGKCNLFIYDNGLRLRLDWDGANFTEMKSGVTYSQEELLRILEENPHRFSTNVALRTVAQEFILPIAAVIAGAGEVAYFGQFKKLFAAYDMELPVCIPRASITLVEKKVATKMQKLDFSFSQLGDLSRVLQASLQALRGDTSRRATATQEKITAEVNNMQSELLALDGSLQKWSDKIIDRIIRDLSRLAARIGEVEDNSSRRVQADFEYIANHIYPGHKPQERMINILQFLVRHGPDFIDILMEKIDFKGFDHQVIEI
ncbi:bacillithiol biosynthesis cysteine-adding enzyme BshC [Planctomycetota bacterium]